MIPDAAVEAAKEAMREVTPPPGVGKSDWLAEHGDFALIAGAIAAAAPHMLAEAWLIGHESGFYNGRLSQLPASYAGPRFDTGADHAKVANPYRTTK